MRFWDVRVFNSKKERYECFGVCSDEDFDFRKLKKIILEVHPEYKEIKVRRSKKPKNW